MMRHGDTIDMTVRPREGGSHCLGPSSETPTLPWSQITHGPDVTKERLVILGDPGYGKTVAALTLVAHVNSGNRPLRSCCPSGSTSAAATSIPATCSWRPA